MNLADVERRLKLLSEDEIRRLLLGFPTKQWKVFSEKWFLKKTYRQVARAMDSKYSTVKANYRHALVRIEPKLPGRIDD